MGHTANEIAHCTYCGDYAQARDHVVPVSVNYVFRNYREGETAPCCRECNSVAGNHWPDSLCDKALFLMRKYEIRYKKALGCPEWHPLQINELGGMLKSYVQSMQNKRRLAVAKIRNLDLVAQGYKAEPIDFLGLFGKRIQQQRLIRAQD